MIKTARGFSPYENSAKYYYYFIQFYRTYGRSRVREFSVNRLRQSREILCKVDASKGEKFLEARKIFFYLIFSILTQDEMIFILYTNVSLFYR